MSTTNYAQLFGIKSVAAAFIFAVAYVPFDIWFIMQAIRRPNSVYNFLIIFCIIRTAAFVLRGILAASDSVAQNESAFITYEVLSGVGFFGLLFSAYTLVLDRFTLVEREPPQGPIAILRNKRLFHLTLTAGVIVGIIGTTDLTSSDPSKLSLGQTLHKVSTAIFFVLTLIQAFLTVILLNVENNASYTRKAQRTMWGARNGHYVLLVITILLLVREGFLIVTIGDSSRQNQENLWYPLVAIPEILAIVCYAVPGLIPSRSELRDATSEPAPAYSSTAGSYVPQHYAGAYPQV